MQTPKTALFKSKRWVAATVAMLLSFLVSLPWLGIPEDVAADLREQFLILVSAYIGGQTVTDWATKGRTSGNHVAEVTELDIGDEDMARALEDALEEAARKRGAQEEARDA